jgi:hypothetical protein
MGAEGFCGDNGRSSIFDYGSLPELAKWANGGRFDGGRLTGEQKQLREWYRKLIHATTAPAFTSGIFYGLNHANRDNPDFGRVGDESASGHWLYAFLRRDKKRGQAFLVVANFHGSETLRGVRIRIPHDAQMFLGLSCFESWMFTDRLDTTWRGLETRVGLDPAGLKLPYLNPCSALLLEISHQECGV